MRIYNDIIEDINTQSNNKLVFNNAMVEIYEGKYNTMRFHSDHSLDLKEDSYIGLFSCYNTESNSGNLCKLIIKDKITKNTTEITLTHNSFVLFSTTTNKRYLHKLIFDNDTNTKWLGITFRLSKTFITFKNNIPYINDNNILTLATEQEQLEFYKYKKLENMNTDFVYPQLNYTISVSDLLQPIMEV